VYFFCYFVSITLIFFFTLAFCQGPADITPATELFSNPLCIHSAAISSPTGAIGLQDALICRLSTGAEVYVRGQDGFKNLTFRDGIGIFMRSLNHIIVNLEGNAATIGGGASTYDASHILWEQGKETGLLSGLLNGEKIDHIYFMEFASA
jgi:hypothetical protein